MLRSNVYNTNVSRVVMTFVIYTTCRYLLHYNIPVVYGGLVSI